LGWRFLVLALSLVLVFSAFLLSGVYAQGNVYHVAVNGDDSNPGTEDKPWRTVSYAVTKLKPGDTLIIHEGTYKEVVVLKVSGAEGAPITITGAPGEKVVLDFQGVHSNCFVFSRGVSHVNLENLTLTNCGIWAVSLDGENEHIYLRNLEVANSETGIHMTVGESGKKPWYGPVSQVTIENCLIHDNWVAGIDCTPGPCYALYIRYSKVCNNGVSTGFGADGIGVETGNYIFIEWSEVYGNKGDGIDLCSRNPIWFDESSKVVVNGCLVHDNGLEGVKLWTGGVVENTLIYSNGFTGLDFIYNGKYRVVNTAVVKNAVEIRSYSVCIGYEEMEALGKQDNLEVEIYNSIMAFNGPPDAPVGIYVGPGVKLTSDYNIWYSRSDSEIYLESTATDYTQADITSGKWTSDTGNGAHSIVAGPLFVDLENDDYRLQSGSPAIDAADPENSPSLDILGAPRPRGEGYDIGPYEYGAQAPPKPPSTQPVQSPPSPPQQPQPIQNETQPTSEQPSQQPSQPPSPPQPIPQQSPPQPLPQPTPSEEGEGEGIGGLWLILIGAAVLTIVNLVILIIVLRRRKPLPPPPPPPP